MATTKGKSKSTYIVRTDQVFASSKPHFHGEPVKLSEEEAKPLLKDGRVSKGMTLLDRIKERRVPVRRRLEWPPANRG